MSAIKTIFAAILLACVFGITQGAYFEGEIQDDGSGFEIFGVFGFVASESVSVVAGEMAITIHGGKPGTTARAIIYSDQDSSWGEIFDDADGTYNDKLTCTEKSHFSKVYDSTRNKWTELYYGQPTLIDFSEGDFVGVFPVYQQSRPRYWYIGIENCDDPSALQGLTYTAHFTQSYVDNAAWEAEFSVESNGLQSLYLSYFIFMSIYLAVHIYGVKGLNEQLSYVHPLVKLFTFIVVLEYLSVIFLFLHYAAYAGDGVGIVGLYFTGLIFDTMSRLGFMILLMLVAKGWTISSETLEGRNVIVGTFCALFAVQCLLLLWEYLVRIPEAIYPPLALQIFQYITITFWLAFAAWYAKTCKTSYDEEQNEEKKEFFKRLGISYTIWILALPVFAYVGLILAPWVQVIVSTSLTLSVTCLGYWAFTFLVWPSRATNYFSINVPQVSTGALDYARL